MKAQATILQAVLIFSIATGLVIAIVPWAYQTIGNSMDSAEINNIKAELLKCSDKILETARTGSGNKCILSVERGELEVKRDGIYYTILSNGEVCSEHDWIIIEKGKQLWQMCKIDGKYLYGLKWQYPQNDIILLEGDITVESISCKNLNTCEENKFSLYNKGVLLVEFYSPEKLTGKNIELTRYSVEANTTVLNVNIY